MPKRVFQRDLVIIQLGTEYSMVAYRDAETLSKLSLKYWNAGDGHSSKDVPTVILLKPDGATEEAFGYDAETKYIELETKGKNIEYFYFKGLKGLNKLKKIDKRHTINDEFGKPLLAIDVYALMINRLIEEALLDITDAEFALVLTLPTDSTSAFCELMEDAVRKAGVEDNVFKIIKNCEAIENTFKRDHGYDPGTNWLTVVTEADSLGITVHQTNANGVIKAKRTIIVEDWGFEKIIKAIESKLITVFGKEVFERFCLDNKDDWLLLKRQLRGKTFIESPQQTDCNVVTVCLPLSLRSKGNVKNQNLGVIILRDKLRLSLGSCLDEILQTTITKIKMLTQINDISAIFMYGRFADVSYFQEKMNSIFKCPAIIIPRFASISVLRGAFLFAQSTEILKERKKPLLVAAIDLGTSYSGWARSYLHEFNESPTKAYSRMWNSESVLTEKTPTCVLIRDDGKTTEAFGYDARKRYQELVLKQKDYTFFYFEYFKMALYNKTGETMDKSMTLEDIKGRSLPAINVFAASIRYLKEDVLQTCQKEYLGHLPEREMRWVITVPGIWSDAAKQFMREAAIEAGIKNRRLTLSLEPEAASIYCRHLPLDVRADPFGRKTSLSSFESGRRYMILDAGGGTTDVTIHEVIDSYCVKEICAASGGKWGGMMVNKAFEKLMKDLVGNRVYKDFRDRERESYLDFMRDFEIKKRTVLPNSTPFRIQIPHSLINIFQTTTGKSLEEHIKHDSKGIELLHDKLSLPAEIACDLFRDSIKEIIELMQGLLKGNKDVNTVLMVGGYSDSLMLQDAVKHTFQNLGRVIPREAVKSIMYGALIFGHKTRLITERVLRYTYGISVLLPFQKGKHPESKLVKTDDGEKCRDLFDKHVQKGQRVKVGESQTERIYSPSKRNQTELCFQIYASEYEDPQFVDENCMHVGELVVDLTDHDGDLRRSVKVSMIFSDTEIVVEATDQKTGEQTYAAINFLG